MSQPTQPPTVEVPEYLSELVDALRALGATGPAVTQDIIEVAPVREYLTADERQCPGLLVLASRITEPAARRAAQAVALRLVEGVPAPRGPLVPE
jgi:hypothetical protein